MEPIVLSFKLKDGIKTIKTDYCTGETPAGSRTFYWIFYLGKDDKGKRLPVARVSENSLNAREKKQAERLYGRPWLRKVLDSPIIRLTHWIDYEEDLEGLPQDTQNVWRINHLPDTWLIEQKSGVTLHVLNNDEQFHPGVSFQLALRALWPDKEIKIERAKVTYFEETVPAKGTIIDPFQL